MIIHHTHGQEEAITVQVIPTVPGAALKTVTRACSPLPRAITGYYYAAVAHLGTGDVDRAAEYAEKAHLMDPGNPDYARLDDRLNRGPVYSYTYSQPDAFSVIASSPGRIFLGMLAIRLILRLILAFFIW